MTTIIIDIELQEITPGFLENRKNDLKSIQEALTAKDLASVEVISHKIAGNAGSYGFHDLGDIGKRMEEAAQAKDIDIISQELKKMKTYLSDIKIEYKKK